MTLSRSALRALIAIFFGLIAVVYAIAWLAPAIGLYHDDAVYLVTAKALAAGHGYTIESLPTPIPQTKYPPLFPGLLALFTLISTQPQWLKILPLVCMAGWLWLLKKLLIKMGASPEGSLLLIGLTAASPAIVFLSTNLLSETLFSLLVTGSLLALVEERALRAGILAGLATLTRAAGVPLIIACILILAVRRRFTSAILFTAAAMIFAAPWFGWSLAHQTHDPYYGADSYIATNVITGLQANEKAIVVSRNLLLLLATPFSLLTGTTNLFAVIGTAIIFGWVLFKRRELVPDLFVALYCLMLLVWAGPPGRLAAPILPFLLWIVWRVFRLVRVREAVAAAVVVAVIAPLWADAVRIRPALASGVFPTSREAGNNWSEMQKLFALIRSRTPAGSILLANLDPLFYLNIGRKAVRGFAPNGYNIFYAPRQTVVTPDQMAEALTRYQVDYVVVTPDKDFAEAPIFHRTVYALERGGVLEPVETPGISPEYQLLRVTR